MTAPPAPDIGPGLPPDALHRACDPASLGFETTAELEPLTDHVGQDEALRALDFGVGLERPGFNVFVLGLPGSGRLGNVRRVVRAHAAKRPTPDDLCYVFDFDEPRRPALLTLAQGRGPAFREAMAELIEDIRRALPEALDADEVSHRRATLIQEQGRKAQDALEGYRQDLESDPWVALVGGKAGFTVTPARGGEPLTPAAFLDLPDEMRAEIDAHLEQAQERLGRIQRDIHRLQRAAHAQVVDLHREVTRSVVAPRIAALREDFVGEDDVSAYLDGVEDDILAHGDRFVMPEEAGLLKLALPDDDFFRRYAVNMLVTHPAGSGAPVVEDTNPTLRNLLGHVGGQVRLGVLTTDFTRILPGAAHRANGGYLVLDAEELLSKPFAWGALKRILRTGELQPADPASELGVAASDVLEPQPVSVRLKVVLVGEPRTYYLLRAFDPDFERLFKVKVDFTPHMDRTAGTEMAYARFVAGRCAEHSLPPFHAGAVSRLVEEGSRRAEDQARLTTRLEDIEDLMVEAAAAAGGVDAVRAAHVDAALAARSERDRRPERELLALIERGVLAFDPTGSVAGQIHGIALSGLGDEPVGRPIRVLASAFPGSEGVVNIEREAELAGPIQTKGFLVLSGYLGRHFARTAPLVLTATVSFDQLYEEVEGDSAAAAELYALMSAIAGVPLRQGVGVTGAINQEGLLLPVGGVTHKVEGFYEACRRKGLTGDQGVLIPRRNLPNLVLHREVRDAVGRGDFHLWAVDRVEDGWPVVAGMAAGQRDAAGDFPRGTVHEAVQERLSAWAALIHSFTAGGTERD